MHTIKDAILNVIADCRHDGGRILLNQFLQEHRVLPDDTLKEMDIYLSLSSTSESKFPINVNVVGKKAPFPSHSFRVTQNQIEQCKAFPHRAMERPGECKLRDAVNKVGNGLILGVSRTTSSSEVRVLATQSLNHNDRLDAQAVDMQNLRGELQARITGLERRVERVERYREDTRRWRNSLDASVQTAFRALRVAPVADTIDPTLAVVIQDALVSAPAVPLAAEEDSAFCQLCALSEDPEAVESGSVQMPADRGRVAKLVQCTHVLCNACLQGFPHSCPFCKALAPNNSGVRLLSAEEIAERDATDLRFARGLDGVGPWRESSSDLESSSAQVQPARTRPRAADQDQPARARPRVADSTRAASRSRVPPPAPDFFKRSFAEVAGPDCARNEMYMSMLHEDSSGKVEDAIHIHFTANSGLVPDVFL